MRVRLIFMSLLITGCAPTTEMVYNTSKLCGAGQVMWCSSTPARSNCGCVTNADAKESYRQMFEVQDQIRRASRGLE